MLRKPPANECQGDKHGVRRLPHDVALAEVSPADTGRADFHKGLRTVLAAYPRPGHTFFGLTREARNTIATFRSVDQRPATAASLGNPEPLSILPVAFGRQREKDYLLGREAAAS